MGHITITRAIGAPLAAVFEYVDDHRNTTKYMKGLTRWVPLTDVVQGKGAEFEVVMRAGPRDLRSVVRITGWAANRTIAWKSIDGFKQTGKWSFSRRGEQTEATFDMEYDLGGGIAGRLLGRVAEPVVRHNIERSVDALKVHMQTHASVPKAQPPSKLRPGQPASSPTAAGSPRPRARAANPHAPAKRSGGRSKR